MSEIKLLGCPLITINFSLDKQPTDDFEETLKETLYRGIGHYTETYNIQHSGYDFTIYINILEFFLVDPAMRYLVNTFSQERYNNVSFEIKGKMNLKNK